MKKSDLKKIIYEEIEELYTASERGNLERYKVTFDIYVWAKNDTDIRSQSKDFAEMVHKEFETDVHVGEISTSPVHAPTYGRKIT